MRVLVADKLDPETFQVLADRKLEIVDRAGISPDELMDEIRDFEALVVRSRTQVDKKLIAKAKALKVIGRAGTGVDNIDIDAASRRGIIVMNTPGANSNSAAEHTIAMMATMSRNIAAADQHVKNGGFDKKRFTGVELRDKTLALVGMGRIGLLVAEKALGLGMSVIGFDPVIPADVAARMGIELMDLDQALARADFVSLHVPLLDSTRHIINAENIAKMKTGVRIINCARGGLIDEPALAKAIEGGQVAGAALDVFEVEPPQDNPLLAMKEVLVTPHLGAATHEAQEIVGRRVLLQIADFLEGGNPQGAVNGLPYDEATREEIEPFLKLAEKLGKILAATAAGCSSIHAHYYGPLTQHNIRPLTAHFLKGYLGSFAEDVNELNAYSLAKGRGIELEESTRDEHRSFTSLIYFTTKSERGKNSVAGTLFGKNNLRIVRLAGFNIDAVPEGNMLVVMNEDKPGVIGAVGQVLGQCSVNIANLSLGRNAESAQALAIFNLDSRPDSSALVSIRKIRGVQSVHLISI